MNSRSTCIFLCINFRWLGNSKLITKKVVANLLGYFLVETNGLYMIAYLVMILKLFPFLIRCLESWEKKTHFGESIWFLELIPVWFTCYEIVVNQRKPIFVESNRIGAWTNPTGFVGIDMVETPYDPGVWIFFSLERVISNPCSNFYSFFSKISSDGGLQTVCSNLL